MSGPSALAPNQLDLQAQTSLAETPAPANLQFAIPAEQAFDASFLHDFQGRFFDVNHQACEMLGYTREELLSLAVPDISVEYDLPSAQKVWREIQPGKTITIHSRERRKDGSVFPMEARLSGFQIGSQTFILALVRDVTERQRVEQAARESRDQYRLLFDSIDEGFCVIQVLYDTLGRPNDFRFLEVNPAFEKHVGILGATNRTMREIAPDIEQKWIDIYHEVATTGHPTRFKDESPALSRTFDIYAFRIGQPGQGRIAVLFTNISERIAAEKALLRSEKLALVGLLSGVISHEIRNPIDSIDNLFYLAAQESDVTTLHEYIRIAQGELNRISNIVTHTLHFNRQSFTLPATASPPSSTPPSPSTTSASASRA